MKFRKAVEFTISGLAANRCRYDCRFCFRFCTNSWSMLPSHFLGGNPSGTVICGPKVASN